MSNSLYKVLAGVILGVFLSLLFKGCGGEEKGIPVGKPIITYTRDTLYLPSKVVYQTRVVPKLVYVDRKVTDTLYKSLPKDSLVALLAHREYQDSVTLGKGLKVGYRASTRGLLDSLHLGLADTRPTKVIHDSTVITQAVERDRWRIGVGTLVSPTALSPGIQVEKGRHQIGLHYSILPVGQVTLGYHFTLRR